MMGYNNLTSGWQTDNGSAAGLRCRELGIPEEDEDSEGDEDSVVGRCSFRGCNYCRFRKIRCDGEHTSGRACSNCIRVEADGSFSDVGQRASFEWGGVAAVAVTAVALTGAAVYMVQRDARPNMRTEEDEPRTQGPGYGRPSYAPSYPRPYQGFGVNTPIRRPAPPQYSSSFGLRQRARASLDSGSSFDEERGATNRLRQVNVHPANDSDWKNGGRILDLPRNPSKKSDPEVHKKGPPLATSDTVEEEVAIRATLQETAGLHPVVEQGSESQRSGAASEKVTSAGNTDQEEDTSASNTDQEDNSPAWALLGGAFLHPSSPATQALEEDQHRDPDIEEEELSPCTGYENVSDILQAIEGPTDIGSDFKEGSEESVSNPEQEESEPCDGSDRENDDQALFDSLASSPPSLGQPSPLITPRELEEGHDSGPEAEQECLVARSHHEPVDCSHLPIHQNFIQLLITVIHSLQQCISIEGLRSFTTWATEAHRALVAICTLIITGMVWYHYVLHSASTSLEPTSATLV